ncbi:radical SAM protein [Candidatus Woesearchaeota archaeon]|nr:radical SAM protein [Candidatus Woesearchaeota archaeon]
MKLRSRTLRIFNPVHSGMAGRRKDLSKGKKEKTVEDLFPLEYFNVNISEGCTSRCSMCRLWKLEKKNLSFEAFRRAVDAISPLLNKEKKIFLTLSAAGEPMINREIYKMIRYGNDKGFHVTTITNSMLITQKSAEELIKSGLFHINLSLESNTPEINDSLRGIKGHHRKVTESIRMLDHFKKKFGSGCALGIHTTICSQNMDSIPNLVRWVNEDPRLSAIRFQAITQVFGTPALERWYEHPEFSDLWPKDGRSINTVYDELIEMKKSGAKIDNTISSLSAQRDYFLDPVPVIEDNVRCNVYQGIMIHADGRIDMCPVNQKVLGNSYDPSLNTRNLSCIIQKEQAWIKGCNRANCHFVINCKFN